MYARGASEYLGRRGAAREYKDFDPVVEWKLPGEDQDVVEISLPGFRKDQVRVQVVDQIPCTVHDVNRLAALACLHSVELSVLHVEWEV